MVVLCLALGFEPALPCLHVHRLRLLNCNNVPSGLQRAAHYPGVENLYLANTQLGSMQADMLANLTELLVLDVRANSIRNLDPLAFNSTRRIRSLDLSSNLIRSLHASTFQALFQLINLDLSHNFISSLSDGRLFSSQRNLIYLNLMMNKLENIVVDILEPLVSLERFKLDGNPLRCDCGVKRTVEWSQRRCLKTNTVCQSMVYNDVVCDEHDFKHISASSVTCPPENCVYVLWNRRMDCEGAYLRSLHKGNYPLNQTDAVTLVLKNCSIDNLDKYVFSDLMRLINLDLSENNIEFLDRNTFSKLHKLAHLSLHKNRLSYLRKGTFSYQKALVYLDLRENKLNYLPTSIIHELRSLKMLYITGNPLLCNIELKSIMLLFQRENIVQLLSSRSAFSLDMLVNNTICEKSTAVSRKRPHSRPDLRENVEQEPNTLVQTAYAILIGITLVTGICIFIKCCCCRETYKDAPDNCKNRNNQKKKNKKV